MHIADMQIFFDDSHRASARAVCGVQLSSMGDKQDWEAALITDGVYHSSLVRTLSSHY